MLDERTRQNRKMKKIDLIWPFDLEFDLQGQMPFWQAGVSESLAHSDTFWHGCQLWTKNAIKSFFEGLGLPTISSMRWIPCTVHLMLSRRKIRTRYRTSIRVTLNSNHGSSSFSTLDTSGYHNIPIREQDRDKTASSLFSSQSVTIRMHDRTVGISKNLWTWCFVG